MEKERVYGKLQSGNESSVKEPVVAYQHGKSDSGVTRKMSRKELDAVHSLLNV